MPTGPCGINCDVCGLHFSGLCSSCGPGGSEEGSRKLAAQRGILGAPCPVLACAVRKGVPYCSRDCGEFPCDQFKTGPYPLSRGFLGMQERRRGEVPAIGSPSGGTVEVPKEYWEELGNRDPVIVCRNSLARVHDRGGFLLSFCGEDLWIDLRARCIKKEDRGSWESAEKPLLELLSLVYLLTAGPENPEGEMVGFQELKSRHFFTGPHELKTGHLLMRFGRDPEGFQRASTALGCEILSLADASCKIRAFPKVPLFYLLWMGDEEFPPSLSILFDRSIEHHLAADAIWGLVSLVSEMLLTKG
jgi:hypothetical protein